MKTRAIVIALLALAVVLAVGGQTLETKSVAAADEVPGPASFEDWLMQQGEVALQFDHRHRIFQYAVKQALVPVGPLAMAKYCVGDFCQDIELQWFEGPTTGLGTGASWQRWVCYAWVRGLTVECLVYVPTPFP